MAGLRVGIAWLSLSVVGCGSVVEETKGATGTTSGPPPVVAPVCAAGATTACDCPGGTGHATCLADGSGFGPCEACVADVPWSKAFGGEGNGTVPSVIVAPDDSVVATILFFGGSNDPKSRIVKLDPGGNVVWQRDSPGRLRAQAFDEKGNVVVSGWNWDVGITPLDGIAPCDMSDGIGYACVALARLDPWTGAVVWSRTYNSDANLEARVDIAGVTPDDRIGIVGIFDHDLDLGGGAPVVDTAGNGVAYAALLSPDGAAEWVRTIGDAHDALGALPRAAALRDDGTFAITGLATNQLDFGSGVVKTPGDGSGSAVFVAEYGPSGQTLFAELLGSEPAFEGEEPTVSFDAEGNLFLALWAKGTFDLGAGPIGTSGVQSNVIAKLDAAGHPLWSRIISTSSEQLVSFSVTADVAGNAWVCGGTSPMMTFGDAPVPYAGHPDPLLLEWSGAGDPLAQRVFAGSGWQSCGGVAFGKPGVPVITGALAGSIDFGQGPLVAASTYDAFVAKLGP